MFKYRQLKEQHYITSLYYVIGPTNIEQDPKNNSAYLEYRTFWSIVKNCNVRRLLALRKFCRDKCQNAGALNHDIYDCRTVFRDISDCCTTLAQQSIMPNCMWRRFDQSAKQLVVGHTTIVRCDKMFNADCLFTDQPASERITKIGRHLRKLS